jgi:LPS sulfotransferase NodH
MTWSEYDPRYDLPTYIGSPRTYLIATTQRTGSHFLAHLLGTRGALGVPFEYLNGYRSLLELKRRGEHSSERTQLALLEEMKARRTGCSGWFGVKAHWHTWSGVLAQPLLAAQVQPEVMIYLTRQDRVAQAASLVLAEQTGWWVDESQSTSAEPNYSAERIRQALAKIDGENDAWRRYLAGKPYLALTYEAVRSDPQAAVSAVFTALGVDDPGRSNTGFPSPKPRHDDIVEQWAERFSRTFDRGVPIPRDGTLD